MDRKTRQRNKRIKEFRAIQMLNDEIKSGNINAGKINHRIAQVKNLMNELTDLSSKDQDFISREFMAELEKENKLMVNMTLSRGWPKTYLHDLFAKRKAERRKEKKKSCIKK